jgi:cell division protein FtsZ
VRSITDLMVMPGLINLDFADVRSVMGEMGKAMMGTGEGEGPNRALEAAERAIANPLLDGVSMQGAKGVIISIIGGDDMKLLEVDEAANHIRELVDPNANIIWGSAFNPDLDGKIRVSVVATGIEQTTEMAEIAARPATIGGARGPAFPGGGLTAPSGIAPRPPVAPPAAPQPPIVEPMAPPPVTSAPVAEPAPVQSHAPPPAPEDEPFDLTLDLSEEPAPAPGLPRFGRASVAPADATEPPAPARPAAGNSTLFERMANLSRGSRPAEEEPTDEDGKSLNIPRFLGRQNNQ